MKFSGTGVFRHEFDDPQKITKFEERIVVVEAVDENQAKSYILQEFDQYAVDGISFTGTYEIKEIYKQEGSITEVASTMKVFDGTDEEYVKRFWDDQKPESCDKVGWSHVWFNRRAGLSGCYNCLEERLGELWHDT